MDHFFLKKINYKQALILYTIIFAILFGVAYIPFFLSGRTFVTKVDGIDQYYMGFYYFGEYLRHLFTGHAAPLYDLSIGMGEDILGALNYYGFADPVYLVSAFADGQMAPFIYSFSFFVRIYLAGISFLAYCRQMRLDPFFAVAGAFCFIVNGFTYGGVTSYMGWGSVLIYLPLMLIAVEKTFKNESKAFPIMLLSSVYAALCGFYFLYMSCIFLILYCLGRGIAIFGVRSFFKVITCSLKAALPLVLGILFAGPVFFPSIMGFMGSERSDISIFDILFDKENWTPYLPVYLSFINKPAHYYFKYISKITWAQYIAVIFAFFLPRSRAKIQLCTANLVIMLTVALPVTGYIFSGFGESGFEVNTRWAFLIHFIFAVTLVYVLGTSWPGAMEKKALRVSVTALLLILTALCTIISVKKNVDADGGRLDPLNIARNMDSPALHSVTLAEDDSVYRVSMDHFMTTSDRPENSAMIHGYYGITYWLSIMNDHTQYASDVIKGEKQEWRSDGFGHEGVFETAYGVKYYLGKGENPVPEGYEEVECFDYYGEKWHVYENSGWVGIGYTRDSAAAQELLKVIKDEENLERGELREYFDGVLKASERLDLFEYDRAAGRIVCETAEASADELVVSIPYNSGWKAYLDGKPVDTRVADLMCMAINTGGGAHRVELIYESAGFKAGTMTMVFSVLLMAAYGIITRRFQGHAS